MIISESFDHIHQLLKACKFDDAYSVLIDVKTGRLNSAYKWDANHAWYCVGLAEFDRLNYYKAANAFRRAYKYNTKDILSLLALGDCYDEMKRPKFAERYFREALKKNPKGEDRAALLFNLGNALFDQHKYSEALDFFRKVSRRSGETGEKARKNLKRVKLLCLESGNLRQ